MIRYTVAELADMAERYLTRLTPFSHAYLQKRDDGVPPLCYSLYSLHFLYLLFLLFLIQQCHNNNNNSHTN